MTTTPDWEGLGDALRQARGSRKIAPSARAVGISPTQLSNYEKASPTSGRPPMERLLDLAEFYGTDPDPWLALVGYERGTGSRRPVTDRNSHHSGAVEPSGVPANVPSTEVTRPERNVVRISAQAIGWELSATYTDAEDRVQALEDIAKAWAAMMGAQRDGGPGESVRPGDA